MIMRNNGTNRIDHNNKNMYSFRHQSTEYVPATNKVYAGQTISTYIPGYGNVRAYVRSVNQFNGMLGLDIHSVYGSWQPIQVHYSYLVGSALPPFRVNPFEILSCTNNWIEFKLTDGTVITAYLKSFNMNHVEGFVSHNAFKSMICQGKVIMNEEEAKPCLKQWVTVVLHNDMSLSFYLTSYNQNYVGGYLKISELLPLSNNVESVVCLGNGDI
ncbi:hypothetical protein [Chengkuizengella sediminis]|uniref:hypothetical protein n=1 Tax=Chengkuizengella sediminis TaxID=1885917 RepID=UPI00138A1C32|nr:hypothetical protein [Chengkuizengella sediminis]NDI34408.1 hypothetical protein [Chengkuizengella sediminis]